MIRLVAALALLLASLSVASARGAGGVMVLCTGVGLVSVPVGPDGGPEGDVGPPEACPDGVLLFALAPEAPRTAPPLRLLALAAPLPLAPPALRALVAPRARDPPRRS